MKKRDSRTNIDEASRELADELKKDEDLSMDAFLEHATNKMSPGFERIVEKIVMKEPLAEYERLERELTIGPDRSDRATLVEALDKAEDNTRIAHKLYCNAYVERKRWEVDQETVLASIRTRAVVELEREKKEGLRTKQITDADVTSKMAALFPDEYRHAVKRDAEVQKMVEHTLWLAQTWQTRCATLRVQVEALRR